jgi:hypothetical protein
VWIEFLPYVGLILCVFGIFGLYFKKVIKLDWDMEKMIMILINGTTMLLFSHFVFLFLFFSISNF